MSVTGPESEEYVDPALVAAVVEIESHVAESGWDQPGRLFALVDTARLIAQEPAAAAAMGLDLETASPLTPVEQDQLPPGQELEQVLAGIFWPEDVIGCAAVVERLVLPPEVEAQIPDDPIGAAEFAASHELRQEVRIAAAVTRDGTAYCALRLKAHDNDESVVGSADLVPELLELLRATLSDDLTEDLTEDVEGEKR